MPIKHIGLAEQQIEGGKARHRPEALVTRFEFEHELTSGQQLRDKHWSYRQKDREKWFALIRYAFKSRATPFDHLTITITRVLRPRQRAFDHDNFAYGSAKQIVDAFKRLGWIKDDKAQYVTVIYKTDSSRRSGNVRTVIEIEPGGRR